MRERAYIAIDLKAYYASAECVQRGLDPLTTNLVVADASRTEKTICLAVSPSLKAYGITGRPRLFEVVEKVREINARRQQAAPGRRLTGSSYLDPELKADPGLDLSDCPAPDGPLYPMQLRYLRGVFEVCGPRGHLCLFVIRDVGLRI